MEMTFENSIFAVVAEDGNYIDIDQPPMTGYNSTRPTLSILPFAPLGTLPVDLAPAPAGVFL